MRVRTCYTIDADEDYRRAINNFYGLPGLANREAVRAWLIAYGSSMDDDLASAQDTQGEDE